MTDIIEGELAKKSVELDRGGKNIPGAFFVKASHYIIGGFALATAIAWNSSIHETIQSKFPKTKDNIKANLLYAIIITIILVLLIYILPNTKTELPDSTRHKITEIQQRYLLQRKIVEQEQKLRELEAEFRVIQKNNSY